MRRYSKGMAAAIGRYLDAVAALRNRRSAGSGARPERIEPIAPIQAVRPPAPVQSRSLDEQA